MGRIFIFVGLLTGLAACGDPLRNVDRLSDVAPRDNISTAGLAEAPSEAAPRRGALLSGLLNRRSDDPTNAAVEAALADVGVAEPGETDLDVPVEAAATIEEPQPQRAGLFGLFGGNRTSETSDTAPEPAGTDEAQLAAVDGAADVEGAELFNASAVTTPAPEPETDAPRRRGLGGLLNRRAPEAYTGPDAQIVEAGTVLPLGDVARVCDLPNSRRGSQVANVAGFKIYDTIPNSNAARPHYITGFDDNCARTFTAAVVIPSDIETHEFLRYTARSSAPYSEVDSAYEAIKASVCRVGRGQPCGERSDRLSRTTHFLTAYGSFGSSNSVWAEMLLHDGAVLASTTTEN